MSSENKTLFLDGKQFLFGGLKDVDPLDRSSNARQVLRFCTQWQSGEENFEAMTSGSTGEPKKILLRRDQMIASARLTGEALGLKDGMTALLCLDPSLIAGKMMIVRCFVTGMHLIVTNPVANPLDHVPSGLQIDFAAMVPLQASTIIDSGKTAAFSSIKKVILGGGSVSQELTTRLQTLDTQFYATYGMTETVSHVALQKLNGNNRTEYFEGLKGIEFSLDERGCLIINASHLGSQAIVTNDLVTLIDPKKFIWLGRWDNIINTGGIKVMPEELEAQIGSYFLARGITNKFFVTSTSHHTLGSEVVLIVEGDLSEHIETEVLIQLKDLLEKYKAPRRILYAPRFNITTMGKVKRAESLAMASPRPGR